MRRHLFNPLDFDSTSHFLDEPKEEWDVIVKNLHIKNRKNILAQLKSQFGENNFDIKIANLKEIGGISMSIVSYHNVLFHQIRNAFVSGYYYPALLGACALGERVLNHLIIDLRDYYKGSPHYRKIYNKDSFDDWDKALEILEDWKIFNDDEVKLQFKVLKKLRHKSVHFNPETYKALRDDALSAVVSIGKIIALQFGVLGSKRWIIDGTQGAFFIKKEMENNPFIKTYFLQQCPKVSPYYTVTFSDQMLPIFFDWKNLDDSEIDDSEFAKLHSLRKPEQLVPNKIPPESNVLVQYLLQK